MVTRGYAVEAIPLPNTSAPALPGEAPEPPQPVPLTALLVAAYLEARPPDLYAETFCQQPVENHLDRHHYHTTTSSGNIVEPVTGSLSDEIGERIRTAYYTPWDFRAK